MSETKLTIAGRALLAAVILLACNATSSQADDDVQTISNNIISDITQAGTDTVLGYLDNLNSDGSFSDINYSDTGDSTWSPSNHLTRLRYMVKAYTTPTSDLYHDTTNLTLSKILSVYDNWISNDYQASDWWYDEIDTPNELAKIMLMLKQDGNLSGARLTSGTTIVARAYLPRTTTTNNTGENRVWRANASLINGLLTNNTSLIGESFNAVTDTLTITSGKDDGIKQDESFYQHGALLYSGSYGMNFCQDITRIGTEGVGTAYGFSEDNVKKIIDYILDGQQWFIRGKNFDLLTTGRTISRKTAVNMATSNMMTPTTDAKILSNLSASGYRLSELNALYSRLYCSRRDGEASSTSYVFSGNKQFWKSDIMVHQRAEYYTSVKTVSTRTVQPEISNGENLKSLHEYDGVNLIMRTGNEYNNIQPVWDWNRLPGTTTERKSYSLTPTVNRAPGTSTYDGGVSDGTYGMTAFEYSRLNVSAQKAWFFFDNEYVALGSNINAPDAGTGSPVATSVNQTLLNGDVVYKTVSGGTTTLAYGSKVKPDDACWVNHDSIGYFFIGGGTRAIIRAQAQTGSWGDINEMYDSTETVTEDVFSLDVNHGIQPNGATYAYVVRPDLSADEMDNYYNNMPIVILRNDANVQAVEQTVLKLVEAAFYEADTLVISDDLSVQQVTSGVGSLIMIDASTDDQLTFSVASPEALAETLEFRVNGHLIGDNAIWDAEGGYTTLMFTLPGDELAGSTVSSIFTVVPEPATGALLLMAGVALLIVRARRRAKLS